MNQENKRSSIDAIIELYKKDVDVTLLKENLKLTPEQRLRKMEDFMNTMERLRDAGRKTRREPK